MTPEQTARERAQAEADRTGKPHVVLHSDQYGFEAVSVEWWASYHEETPGTSFREVQRIDPAPAKGPVEVRMLCESESYNHGYDEGYRQGHIDGKAAQRHTAPAPPAPLARDMTRELAEALQECVWAMMGVLQGDEPLEAFPRLAPMMDLLRDHRAVLAAEGRKP